MRLGVGDGMTGLSLSLTLAVFAFFSVRSVSDMSVCSSLAVCFSEFTTGDIRRGAIGGAAPEDDFCLVDLVARVGGGRQARGFAHRTVDVGDCVAGPAH